MSKTNIGFAAYEMRGHKKSKLFEYKSITGDHELGMATMNLKLGLEMKEYSEKVSKKLRY